MVDGELSDSRLNVARYRVDRLVAESDDDEPETNETGQASMSDQAQYVEVSIQQAMRRGEFENLPGAGKPLQNLGGIDDPDWWIRAKIEREKISGLGPPALTLRTENAELDARLDAVFTEDRVREIIAEFNRRIIEARRQLMGGPPVVTPTRDADQEVARWRERDAVRREQRRQVAALEQAALDAMTPRERRRAKRRR